MDHILDSLEVVADMLAIRDPVGNGRQAQRHIGRDGLGGGVRQSCHTLVSTSLAAT